MLYFPLESTALYFLFLYIFQIFTHEIRTHPDARMLLLLCIPVHEYVCIPEICMYLHIFEIPENNFSDPALPYSSEPIAFIPHAFEHGRSCLMIALYGQASRHFPHLMQASSSICDLPPSICTAFFGQTSTQGCSRQP